MRDIDRWAMIVQEAEDGYTSLTKEEVTTPASRIPLERYKRFTVEELVNKLKQSVAPYEKDFTVKFIDIKTKKASTLAVLSTRVDTENDELQVFFDLK